MENRINNRVVIAVNKRNKLLGYLRKLNSGDIEEVGVRIIHTPKGKPINLFFTRSGTVDNFLVYVGYWKAGSKKKVVLGSATIESLQKIGFISADNRESKECVAINVYTKEDSLDFKELQDILFSIKRLSTYGLTSTSAAILIELKPENKNIISYEVSMTPKSLVDLDTAKKETYKREPHYACHSKNSNSTVTESERGTQEVLRQRHSGRINYTLEITIASSIVKSDLKKPLKKWNKILEAKPIEIFTDTFHQAGNILDFYIKESTFGANGVIIDNGTTPRYELVAKYSINNYVANSRDRGITTPGFALKALHNAYVKYKQRKNENLDISHLGSLIEENKYKQRKNKDLTDIVVPFSIVLKDIMAYDHILDYTKLYKATFRIKNKEFKGEIKSINIHNPFATTVNTRRAFPYGIKTIVNIAITQECKDTIDNLVKGMGIGFEEVCVGSLDHHLLRKSAGALYTIKSYTEKEDLFCKKAKMSSRKHKENSPVSFGCSIPNIFIQRLRIKDNKSIDTKNLSAVFEIGNKVFNGTVAKASIGTNSAMASFPISVSVSTGVSLEILIDNDSKKIIQNLLDKTGLETAAVGKLMLETTINDNINQGSTYIYKPLKQIGVIYINKDSSSDKVDNSDKDIHTALPCHIPPLPHPTVSILGNSALKKKIKEIIEEANKSKSSNTISNKIDSSLCQKEDNPLILYLDVPVAKSILLSKALDSLKEWKKILSIKPISIPFSGDLKIGHVSSFVYRAHSPKSGDCTYEVAAKCEINNTAAKEIISKFSINPNLLGPTIRASITKSLEKAYHDYATEKRIMEPYPHPIRYTDCFINESINKHIDKTVMIFVTNFLDIHDYTNIINGSSNYSVNLQIENMIFQGEVFCAEIEGVDPRSRKLKNEDRYIPRVLLRVRVSNNCKNAIISMRKSQGTIHSSIGKLVKKEMFSSETKLVGTVFMHKTSFMDC